MFKLIIIALLTLALIGYDYKKNQNLKKSLTAVAVFIFILSVGFSGFVLTRAVLPLFFMHIVTSILAYMALVYYILKNRLYWQMVILPAVTVAIYVALNFIEGSRYEASLVLSSTFA
jgi:hypothetical protein